MSELPSGLPVTVGDEESVIRFAFSRKKELWLAEPPGRLKPAALLPDARAWPERPLETSIFRHRGEPESELTAITEVNFSGREPKGAGVFSVKDVRQAELDVQADETPPSGPRHANIIGWDENADPKIAKASWKERAIAIAGKSRIVWRSEE